MRLNSTVRDSWRSLQELVLHISIVGSNNSLLLSSQLKDFLLLSLGKVSICSKFIGHLTLDHGKHGITLISHATRSDTIESSLEGGSLNVGCVLRILSHSKNLINGAISYCPHGSLQVVVLENLDLVQHGKGPIVEV